MENPIFVALDLPDPDAALKLVASLGTTVGGFKIGSELFVRGGTEIVKRIRGTGAKVFLDLKFHDIPNTVASAVAAAVSLDVQLLTVHISGGMKMMQAAERAAQETAKAQNTRPPLVLGVTVLTSHDAHDLSEVGLDTSIGKQVERLASLAAKAGLRGLVCSPLELTDLRSFLPSHMQLVTPGIRSGSDKADDQKRTLSAREAIAAGANWLVIGRPIHAAANPRQAAETILQTLS